MKICIIGNSKVSEQLQASISVAHMEACIVSDVASADTSCDLMILNTGSSLEVLQKEVALLTKKTTSPVAVVVVLDYVAAVARYAEDKHNVVGLRLMGENYIGQYIEITKTEDTDESVYMRILKMLNAFNDRVVEIPDIIGGLFYRMMPVQLNMAATLVSEGVIPTDVDNSMRYGANIKRQPLHIIDELGVDYLLNILESIYYETGRPAYRPCPLLRKMVSAGRLGKKVGIGFFKYD